MRVKKENATPVKVRLLDPFHDFIAVDLLARPCGNYFTN